MRWIRAKLRGTPVFVRATDEGQPAEVRGLVEIVYQKRYTKTYRARVSNLEDLQRSVLPDEQCPRPAGESTPGASEGTSNEKKLENEASDGTWQAWTDGACSGNPGPAGLGVVLLWETNRWELSEYLGQATNNIAELTAILRALEKVPVQQPLIIHTDSQYSIGVLRKGWKAKANKQLIETLKKQLAQRPNVRLRYVRGHAGERLNEQADRLARQAVSSKKTQQFGVPPEAETTVTG